MNYVGLDYHKRYTVASAMNEAGQIVWEERLEHRYGSGVFERFFERLAGPGQVVFEASLNWSWLYEVLEQIKGIERIVMASPYQTRIIAAAQIKTDKLDARKLAMLLKADLIPAVHIPDRATRARKDVLRQRIFLVRQRTRIRNRIHQLLGRQHNLAMPQVSDLFGAKGRAALNKVLLADPDDALLRQNLAVMDTLNEQIKQEEKRIALDGAGDPDIEWITSVPGIGLILGNVIATEIDGVKRFVSADKLCAYAGLVPSTQSSGDKTFHGRTLSACNKWLKWAFVEASWVAVGCSEYFGGIYRAHRARGKKATIGIMIVARRMCRIVWQLLKEHRGYENRPVQRISPAALVRH